MKWDEIERALKSQKVERPMVERDAFWAEFERRRHETVPNAQPSSLLTLKRWAPMAAAAAVVLLAGWFTLQYLHTSPPQTPSSAVAQITTISSVTVDVAHSAIMIMDDAAGQGTIVWVSGITPPVDVPDS